MASGFNLENSECQGKGCRSTLGVTYDVKERKSLCSNCASKETNIINANNAVVNLLCDEHNNQLELYCERHAVALCQICVLKYHRQDSCQIVDIKHAITTIKTRLQELTNSVEQRRTAWQQCIKRFEQDTRIENRLAMLKHEISGLIDESITRNGEREKRKFEEISERANEEIRMINEKREKDLMQCRDDAERRREAIDQKRSALLADHYRVVSETTTKTNELLEAMRDGIKAIEDGKSKIQALLSDGNALITDGQLVLSSLTNILERPTDLDEEFEKITNTVSRLSLMKGRAGEEFNGRIGGCGLDWHLTDTIRTSKDILRARTVGYLDGSHVMIRSFAPPTSNYHAYALDISDGRGLAVKTFSGSVTSRVICCAALNDLVVCGKFRADSSMTHLNGCISLYDRQWNLIRDIAIRNNTKQTSTKVNVAVDKDGMIIAAEWNQSKVYVINPSDGSLVNTITCKQDIVVHGVLSSGHIVVRSSTEAPKLMLIDREGTHKELAYEGPIWNCTVDSLTDAIYIVTSDQERATCRIDQLVVGDGEVVVTGAVQFPVSPKLADVVNRRRLLDTSNIVITPSGRLIASDGENILVFKKLLLV